MSVAGTEAVILAIIGVAPVVVPLIFAVAERAYTIAYWLRVVLVDLGVAAVILVLEQGCILQELGVD